MTRKEFRNLLPLRREDDAQVACRIIATVDAPPQTLALYAQADEDETQDAPRQVFAYPVEGPVALLEVWYLTDDDKVHGPILEKSPIVFGQECTLAVEVDNYIGLASCVAEAEDIATDLEAKLMLPRIPVNTTPNTIQ